MAWVKQCPIRFRLVTARGNTEACFLCWEVREMSKSAPRIAYRKVQELLAEMEAASELDDLADAWEVFLIYHQRVWNKSEAYYKGEAFWGRIRQKFSARRKSDPVLQYVHQARHADEHGVQLISEVADSQTRVSGPGTIMPGSKITGGGDSYLAPGSTATVAIDPSTIVARDVTNRGDTYPVPAVQGAVRPHAVIELARHAVRFYADLFSDIDLEGGS